MNKKKEKEMTTAYMEPVSITMTELKNNLGKYLELPKKGQNVYVTKNGKSVACITSPKKTWLDELNDLKRISKAELDSRYSIKAASNYYKVKETQVTDEMLADYYKKLDNETKEEYYRDKYER